MDLQSDQFRNLLWKHSQATTTKKMALNAVIFDLDGTILDTNRAHARAWKRSLDLFHFAVGEDRILLEIGKGGQMLVPTLLGDEAERRYGEDLRTAHDELFAEIVQEHPVHVFPGVREVFEALRKHDLKVAVSTASKQDNLDQMLTKAGLDLSDMVDVIVTDSDVNRSKPHPDVVTAAVQKLDMAPGQCTFVGDTPYDVIASFRAGVTCLGVLTGAWDAGAMQRAGARATYMDMADLHANLDEALTIASPGPVSLTADLADRLMQEALAEARAAMAAGEKPVGSVVARGDGVILARGQNRLVRDADPVAHADIVALLNAAGKFSEGARDLILATTNKPCIMCLGAALEARVDTILVARDEEDDLDAETCLSARSPDHTMPRMIKGIRLEESRALMDAWQTRNPGQQ